MRRLKAKLPRRMDGAAEVGETYVTVGLKGGSNSRRIERLGRKLRRRGLKRRGRGSWSSDKPPIFILVDRGGLEDHMPSSDVEAETALKLVERRVSKGSTVYTDGFKAYSNLGEAGYGMKRLTIP